MRSLLTCVLCLGVPAFALAQADEVQVYDGGLAPTGVFNLTVHTNWIAKGVTTPAFTGGVTPDRSLNGVPEWALGVTRWFEAGLYLPLYTWDRHRGWGLDGLKLRTLFAVPNGGGRGSSMGWAPSSATTPGGGTPRASRRSFVRSSAGICQTRWTSSSIPFSTPPTMG